MNISTAPKSRLHLCPQMPPKGGGTPPPSRLIPSFSSLKLLHCDSFWAETWQIILRKVSVVWPAELWRNGCSAIVEVDYCCHGGITVTESFLCRRGDLLSFLLLPTLNYLDLKNSQIKHAQHRNHQPRSSVLLPAFSLLFTFPPALVIV